MPLKGARYRVKTNPDGSKTRLAFVKGKVVEVKKLGKGHVAHKVKSSKSKK